MGVDIATATFDQQGLLNKTMDAIGQKMGTAAAKRALLKEAPPVLQVLAAGAPRSKGRIAARRRAMGYTPLFATMDVNFYGRKHGAKARLGPLYPTGAQSHLIDAGTKDRQVKEVPRARTWKGTLNMQRMGRNRGRITARHWIDKAWNPIADHTVEQLNERLLAEALKDAAKMAKAGGASGALVSMSMEGGGT